MSAYAASRPFPAGPLAEIQRRRAQKALQVALSASARINLLEEAIGSAVQDARELLEQEVAMRAGERYERCAAREGKRNGTAPGYVVVGGRKVQLRRPRLLTEDGRELPLASYRAMQDPTILDQAALGKVIDGVAQRQAHESYARDQRLPADQPAYGDSKSSISRRWIEATGESLAERMNRRLRARRRSPRPGASRSRSPRRAHRRSPCCRRPARRGARARTRRRGRSRWTLPPGPGARRWGRADRDTPSRRA